MSEDIKTAAGGSVPGRLGITQQAHDVGARHLEAARDLGERDRDRLGRQPPIWQGCRRIQTGEVFLMNWQVRDSLDGRYFGLTSTDRIIGHAVPLWTDEGGNGRFEWRAPTR